MQSKIAPPGLPRLSPAAAWRIVFILMLATIFSYIDRQILSMMVGDLRRDFGLSDTQIGLLQGLPFTIFYTVAGLPIGRLVDRYDRLIIIAVGIVLWCACTAGCAFATSYADLMLLRIGVAVGEAVLVPAAYPLIADCFSRERVGLPTSAYMSSSFVGNGLAYLVGGFALTALEGIDRVQMPTGVTVFGWQLAFLVVGLPGLLVAALAASQADPARRRPWRSAAPNAPSATKPIPLRQVLGHLHAHRRAFVSVMVGVAMITAAFSALTGWAPALFERELNWSAARIGSTFGTMILICCVLGALSSGRLSDVLARRGMIDARMVISSAVAVGMMVLAFFPLVASEALFVAGMALFVYFIALALAVGPASIQDICPRPFRGQVTAIYILVINVGSGIGPVLPPLFTDRVFHDPLKLDLALVIIFVGLLAPAALILWTSRKAFRAAVTASTDWEADPDVAISSGPRGVARV